jgi:hypothetical protein
MLRRIRTEPSAQITTLVQVIASARSRLDGLAEEDPATRPLREHLAELIAKRDALTRTLEDRTYASNKISIRILPFMDLVGIYFLIIAVTNFAARHIGTGVTLLVMGAVFLAFGVPNTVWTWRDLREYRSWRSPRSGESGP